MPSPQIIVASTRAGHKGPAVAAWFHELARAHEAFDVELVGLGAVNLPLLDEPVHPRLRASRGAGFESAASRDAFERCPETTVPRTSQTMIGSAGR